MKKTLFQNILGVLGILLLFHATAWRPLSFDIQNVTEMYFVWIDEGIHLESLESMQSEQSLSLKHKAYTAFYPNLSYLMSFLLSIGGESISSQNFILGSQLVSLLSMNLFFLIGLRMIWNATRSPFWAGLGLLLVSGQIFHYTFATHLHPEALMLLWTSLTLWLGVRFFESGSWKHFAMMALAAGLAIGTKLQVIFLIPWGGLWFLFVLWQRDRLSWKPFFQGTVIAILEIAIGLWISSPYQMLHLPELIQGAQTESQSLQGYSPDTSLWRWAQVVSSESRLGPIFTLFFSISLLIGSFRIWKLWKQEGKSVFQRKPELLFLVHVSWIVVGLGYIVTTYHIFNDRYLIHVYFSFLIVLLLGGYWWKSSGYANFRSLNILVAILLFGGLQIQWRHAQRNLDRRSQYAAIAHQHRQYADELAAMLPQDARIGHTRRVYLSRHQYPNREFLRGNLLVSNPTYYDYLVVNQNFRQAMRSATRTKGSRSEIQQIKDFWTALEQDGAGGRFMKVKEFPEAQVIVYQQQTLPNP